MDEWPCAPALRPVRSAAVDLRTVEAGAWRGDHMAGQNPGYPKSSEHPNPTTKIGPKTGGEFTYPKMGSQNGFDNHGRVIVWFVLSAMLAIHAWHSSMVMPTRPCQKFEETRSERGKS